MNEIITKNTESLTDWRPIGAYLGLDKNAFWGLFNKTDMPHYRFNSRVLRFSLSEVIRWMARAAKGGAKTAPKPLLTT